MRSMYIFSPSCDQSFAIAAFLRRYCPNVEIVGVVLDGEVVLDQRDVYSCLISLSQFPLGDLEGALIPTGARSTKYLLERGDVTIGSVKLTQPALRVYDKPWIVGGASEIGVPTPATWEEVTDVREYPAFYKPRYESGGGARGIARSEADIPVGHRRDLIFQELIDSQGTYGVGFLAEQGQLVAAHTHFESESVPRAGGSAVIIERFEDQRLIEYTRRLVQSLDYSGWGLAEFKYDPHRGDFVFMEVNAKFWASCEFSFVNEPLFLKLLFDIDHEERAVERMVFVNRAFARGPIFMLTHLGELAHGSVLRVYPGWWRQLAVGILPRGVLQRLKTLWAHCGQKV